MRLQRLVEALRLFREALGLHVETLHLTVDPRVLELTGSDLGLERLQIDGGQEGRVLELVHGRREASITCPPLAQVRGVDVPLDLGVLRIVAEADPIDREHLAGVGHRQVTPLVGVHLAGGHLLAGVPLGVLERQAVRLLLHRVGLANDDRLRGRGDDDGGGRRHDRGGRCGDDRGGRLGGDHDGRRVAGVEGHVDLVRRGAGLGGRVQGAGRGERDQDEDDAAHRGLLVAETATGGAARAAGGLLERRHGNSDAGSSSGGCGVTQKQTHHPTRVSPHLV